MEKGCTKGDGGGGAHSPTYQGTACAESHSGQYDLVSTVHFNGSLSPLGIVFFFFFRGNLRKWRTQFLKQFLNKVLTRPTHHGD